MNNKSRIIGGLFRAAYGDLMRMLRERFALVVSLSLTLAVLPAAVFLMSKLITNPLGMLIGVFVAVAAGTYATAPFMVAAYRYVAFDEVDDRPWTKYESAAARSYWAWSMLIATAQIIPNTVLTVLTMSGIYAAGPEDPILLGFMVAIVFVIVAVRLTTLLPTAALDPSNVSLRRALADTKGHFWLIAGAWFLTMLPLIVLQFMVVPGVQAQPWLALPAEHIFNVLTTLLGISLATQLYMRFSQDGAVGPFEEQNPN